jgi:hypothetical protein
VRHPLQRLLVRTQLWAQGDDGQRLFRIQGDGSWLGLDGQRLEPGSEPVWLPHPACLTPEQVEAWEAVFREEALAEAVPQLTRPAHRVEAQGQALFPSNELHTVPTAAFHSLLREHGLQPGAPGQGGNVTEETRSFGSVRWIVQFRPGIQITGPRSTLHVSQRVDSCRFEVDGVAVALNAVPAAVLSEAQGSLEATVAAGGPAEE